jgi:hypothetical protein
MFEERLILKITLAVFLDFYIQEITDKVTNKANGTKTMKHLIKF